jgi:hypothetical protein
MKWFKIHFKDGTDLNVKALLVVKNIHGQYEFYKTEREIDNDVHVKADEVLYIVSVGDADTDSK